MPEDMEKRIAQFVQVRDMLEALDKRQSEERAPLVNLRDRLQGKIQVFMTENKLENLKTAAGTAYTSSRTTCSLSDPHAFMEYVIWSQKFDLLDRRANSTAVKAHIEEKGGLPPGCNITTIETVGVRRRPGT